MHVLVSLCSPTTRHFFVCYGLTLLHQFGLWCIFTFFANTCTNNFIYWSGRRTRMKKYRQIFEGFHRWLLFFSIAVWDLLSHLSPSVWLYETDFLRKHQTSNLIIQYSVEQGRMERLGRGGKWCLSAGYTVQSMLKSKPAIILHLMGTN